MFAAVVEDTTETANAGLFATLATFPDRPKDLEAELTAFARRLAANCMCDRRAAALQKLVETEGQRYPELFEAWRERGPGRVWSAVSARLSRLAHDGLLDLDDPDLAARQLISLVNMDLRPATMIGQRPTDAEVETATRTAVRTFLRAYGRDRPRSLADARSGVSGTAGGFAVTRSNVSRRYPPRAVQPRPRSSAWTSSGTLNKFNEAAKRRGPTPCLKHPAIVRPAGPPLLGIVPMLNRESPTRESG